MYRWLEIQLDKRLKSVNRYDKRAFEDWLQSSPSITGAVTQKDHDTSLVLSAFVVNQVKALWKEHFRETGNSYDSWAEEFAAEYLQEGVNETSSKEILPDPKKLRDREKLAIFLKKQLEAVYWQRIEFGIPVSRLPEWEREAEFIGELMKATDSKDRFWMLVKFVGNTTDEMNAAIDGDIVPLSNKLVAGNATPWEVRLAGFLLRPHAPHRNTRSKVTRRKEDKQLFQAAADVEDIARILKERYAKADLPRALIRFSEEMAAWVSALDYEDEARELLVSDLQKAIHETRNRPQERNLVKG